MTYRYVLVHVLERILDHSQSALKNFNIMFSFTKSRSRLRVENSRSRSRLVLGLLILLILTTFSFLLLTYVYCIMYIRNINNCGTYPVHNFILTVIYKIRTLGCCWSTEIKLMILLMKVVDAVFIERAKVPNRGTIGGKT